MRSGGILMPIFSLPSKYGIGTLGKEAEKFIDFLKKAGQSYWQVLPIGPTGYGDSPYQSFSAFAGNPYFIDLDKLIGDGLLTREECDSYNWGENCLEVDYQMLYQNRYELFRKAYVRFEKKQDEEYERFCKKEAFWLDDFALFMTCKNKNNGVEWTKWESKLKSRDLEIIQGIREEECENINFYKMLQFLFYQQWYELKKYANEKGIAIIGDIPIYVSGDSADVWANPGQFYLNEDLEPIDVAGCPPDAFSEDGQLWGNPLFRWDVMGEDGYSWWISRMKHMAGMFDVIRIDHFRGFDSYYAIPYGDENARRGEWRTGPGIELFQAIEGKLGKLNIIVEDLGFLTDSVRELVKNTGYPGMKVLQFAFDGDKSNTYLPENYDENCVVYTGTHDNDTSKGWLKNASPESRKQAKKYLHLSRFQGYHWGIMDGVWKSTGNLVIVTIQDILGLGSEGRINIPSTMGSNWKWRMGQNALSDKIAEKVKRHMERYKRTERLK